MKQLFLSFLLLISITGYSQKKSSPQVDRTKPPVAGPAPVIKMGDIPSFELPNGLKVFVVENHKLPTIDFSIVLDIQPELEAKSAGVADITGQLITSGTKTRSKDQLDNDIDFIGANLSASATGLWASSLKKHQDKLLELLYDIILNPEFKQEELDKIKTQAISGLATEKDSPDAIAKNVRKVLNYGKNHPYGEIVTEESIQEITLEKCNNYFNTFFRPNVAYMAVVGDVTVTEIKPAIEKYFGFWRKADVPKSTYNLPEAPVKTRVAIVNKPGAVQSVINVTYPVDLKPGNPDVIKAKVMNAILGAGASSRLFINLREQHGYTYGAYSNLSPNELVSEFNAYAKVRNPVTDSAVEQIMIELNRLRSEKVQSEELENIKNYLTGSFAIALEDPSTVANFAINIQRYQLPKDYYANYLKNLAAVTADDVYEMAQKYIHPENATILVVGDKAELTSKMQHISSPQPIEFYDNYGTPIKDEAIKTSTNITAQKVLDDYITAIGGKKAISEVKDITTIMSAKFQGRDLTITTYQKAPNKYAMSINIGSQQIQKEVYDGVKGKQSSMQQKTELTGESLEQIKTQATLFIENKYVKLGYKIKLEGTEKIDGKDAFKLIITSPKGKKSTEYYDVNSKLKIRAIQTSNTEMGQLVQISDYIEYKEVNGVKLPSTISVSGAMNMKLTADKIEVNKELKDDVFNID